MVLDYHWMSERLSIGFLSAFTMSDKMLVQVYHELANQGLSISDDMALMSISGGKAPLLFLSQYYSYAAFRC